MITRQSAVSFLKGLMREGVAPFRTEKFLHPPVFLDVVGEEPWMVSDVKDSEFVRLDGYLTSAIIDEKFVSLDNVAVTMSEGAIAINEKNYQVFMLIYVVTGEEPRYCAFLTKIPIPWGTVVLVKMEI
jgi:hypothetical protein